MKVPSSFSANLETESDAGGQQRAVVKKQKARALGVSGFGGSGVEGLGV